MSSKYRPIGDRIAVKVIPPKDITKGGIVIPDSAKDKPQMGEVVAVGTERYFGNTSAPLEVSVGDKVVFGKYSGSKIMTEEGEELLIMKEDDVLAIIND